MEINELKTGMAVTVHTPRTKTFMVITRINFPITLSGKMENGKPKSIKFSAITEINKA